jgi:hypothetical protein
MSTKPKKNRISIFIAIFVMVIAILACGQSTPEVKPPQNNPTSQSTVSSLVQPSSDNIELATSSPSPISTLKPVGSARSNPAPFGYEVTTEQMTFTVTELLRPADSIVSQGNMFNTIPDEGQEYVFVNLSIKCDKSIDENCNVSQFDFNLVGSAGLAHDTEIFLAGVSGLLEDGDFFGGSTKSGYLAFIVGKEETDLVLIYKPFLSDEVYLSVQP